MKPIDIVFVPQKKWYCTPRAEHWLILSADVCALIAAFFASAAIWFLNHTSGNIEVQDWLVKQAIVPGQVYFVLTSITVVSFWAKGHYSRRRPVSNEAREILNVSVVLALVNAAIVFFSKRDFSRQILLVNWLLVPCMVFGLRVVLKLVLLRFGGWARPMVIVGWGDNALETALAFEGEKLMGYSLVAFLVPDNRVSASFNYRDRSGRMVPSIALGSKPETTLAHLGDPHVVLALEQGGIDAYQDIVQQLGRRNRALQIVPSIRGLPLYGMEVDHFFAHEVLLLTVRNNLARRFPQLVKRAFDIVVSLSILAAATPLLLWVALKVKSSGGAIFYGHKRRGQHNREFACYKFRTMAPNADQLLQELLAKDPEARAEWERDFKLKNDPRITPIGRFLRRTSLDELPQLWNVLKGDMSLVGPRPIVEAELERYGSQIEYYLEAKPGITGLWQISGRNDITYDTRVYLDAWYVKNWSLFNDIVILLRTVKVVFRPEGAY